MLDLEGKMVYSTCSLNPIEDEAVIHRLLAEAKGSLELVDISDKLPGLKYSKGLSHWTVMDRELNVINTNLDNVPEKMKNLIRASIFPPDAKDAPSFHLDRWSALILVHLVIGYFSNLGLLLRQYASVASPAKHWWVFRRRN